MKFNIVKHDNREQWLEWRQSGVGSSDVPVIMGVSRFKKIDQLLREKTQPVVLEEANTYIKDRGNRIEKTVRDFYEKKMSMKFSSLNAQDKDSPHRIASLDGIDEGHNLIVEIKLLSSQNINRINKDADGVKKWINAKTNGTIPEDYYPQIQHQLSVTGAPACVFIGLKEVRVPGKEPELPTDDDLAIVSILPDKEYIEKMNKKIDEFWDKVLKERKRNEERNSNKS